jgi:hypothetical protein
MNQNQTVMFWKPELIIAAQPSGLYVAIRPAPSSTTAVTQPHVRR